MLVLQKGLPMYRERGKREREREIDQPEHAAGARHGKAPQARRAGAPLGAALSRRDDPSPREDLPQPVRDLRPGLLVCLIFHDLTEQRATWYFFF